MPLWWENAERFGQRSPLVIDRFNGEVWLSTASLRVRSLLGNTQPPVIDRAVRARLKGVHRRASVSVSAAKAVKLRFDRQSAARQRPPTAA